MNKQKRYLITWSRNIKSVLVLTGWIICILTGQLNAQTDEPTKINTGQTIILQWIAPPDTDVVGYKAYFYGTDIIYEKVLDITKWYTNSVDDTLTYYTLNDLPLGGGYVKLSAYDRSGNESEKSDKDDYIVIDPAPGKPTFVKIKTGI